MPNVWQAGFYRMDVDRLKTRLRHAALFLGEVGEEVENSSPMTGNLRWALLFSIWISIRRPCRPFASSICRMSGSYRASFVISTTSSMEIRSQASSSSPANVWRSMTTAGRATSRSSQRTDHFLPRVNTAPNGIVRFSYITTFPTRPARPLSARPMISDRSLRDFVDPDNTRSSGRLLRASGLDHGPIAPFAFGAIKPLIGAFDQGGLAFAGNILARTDRHGDRA